MSMAINMPLGGLIDKSLKGEARFAHEEWLRNASHLRRLSKLADRIADVEKILKQKDIEG